MKLRKLLALLLVLVMVFSLLAACSSDKKSSKDDDEDESKTDVKDDGDDGDDDEDIDVPATEETEDIDVPATELKDDDDEDDQPSFGIVGTYKIESFDGKPMREYFNEQSGTEMSDEDLQNYLAILGIETLEDMVVITIEADESFVISFMGNEMKGTWTLSGSTLTLTVDGEDEIATYKNGKITMDMENDGIEMVLVKQ